MTTGPEVFEARTEADYHAFGGLCRAYTDWRRTRPGPGADRRFVLPTL